MTPSRSPPAAPTLLAIALLILSAAVPAAAQQEATVRFDDTLTNGTTVTVTEATLPDGGFLTIHDATLLDGEVLGSVVGHTGYLEAGTHEDVSVELTDATLDSGTYIAMPHKDSDGDRTYGFVSSGGATDGPYTSGGEAVVDDADVTVSATGTLEDQRSDGSSVLVDEITMSDGGFAVIHDSTLFDGRTFASVIGHSGFLEAGTHENVRVELDRPIMEDQDLILMPHRDTDDDGSYDFVDTAGSDDGPYLNEEGSAVVDAAAINVSQTATVDQSDVTTGGHLVHVDSVLVPNGGFVTIHGPQLLEGDAIGSVRGSSSYLEPGLHAHVPVTLHAPLTEDATIVAMPHRDTDGDERYDFVTSDGSDDGPYTADGEIVTDDGQATVSASAAYDRQVSDGRTIIVDTVDLSQPGFVAIHDPTLLAGDALGSVIGHSEHLDAGVHHDVKVSLDTPIATSQHLIAMPHKDTDDDGSYDFVTSEGSTDGPFVADGDIVVNSGFTIVRATVTITDQTLQDSTLTVDRTVLHDGGFIAIHDASLLDGNVIGSVVGHSSVLAPGPHEDVTVELDGDISDGATLIAMPHLDTDGDGTYDFVTSEGSTDGPYVAQTGAVVDTATVQTASSSDDGSAGQAGSADNMTPGPGLLLVLAALGVALVARRLR